MGLILSPSSDLTWCKVDTHDHGAFSFPQASGAVTHWLGQHRLVWTGSVVDNTGRMMVEKVLDPVSGDRVAGLN